MWLEVQTNVPTASGKRIWMTYEMKVLRVRRFEPAKGKTGKGILHYLGHEGGWRAVDVEDICSVNPGRTFTRQGKSLH